MHGLLCVFVPDFYNSLRLLWSSQSVHKTDGLGGSEWLWMHNEHMNMWLSARPWLVVSFSAAAVASVAASRIGARLALLLLLVTLAPQRPQKQQRFAHCSTPQNLWSHAAYGQATSHAALVCDSPKMACILIIILWYLQALNHEAYLINWFLKDYCSCWVEEDEYTESDDRSQNTFQNFFNVIFSFE